MYGWNKLESCTSTRGGGERGYSLKFLVGVCRPHLQIQTQFQTKKCHFPHPSASDLASKNPYPFSDLTLYVIKHNR